MIFVNSFSRYLNINLRGSWGGGAEIRNENFTPSIVCAKKKKSIN